MLQTTRSQWTFCMYESHQRYQTAEAALELKADEVTCENSTTVSKTVVYYCHNLYITCVYCTLSRIVERYDAKA